MVSNEKHRSPNLIVVRGRAQRSDGEKSYPMFWVCLYRVLSSAPQWTGRLWEVPVAGKCPSCGAASGEGRRPRHTL